MEFLEDTAFHLVSSLVGKCHRENVPVRIPVIILEQQTYICSGKAVCLTRACRGFHSLQHKLPSANGLEITICTYLFVFRPSERYISIPHLVKKRLQSLRHAVEEGLIQWHRLRRILENVGSGVDTVAKAPSINHVVTLEQNVIKIELEGYLRTVLHIGSKYLICNIFRIAVMYILIIWFMPQIPVTE